MKRSKIKEKKSKEKTSPFLSKKDTNNKQTSPLKITISGHHIHITNALENVIINKALHFFSKLKKTQHLNVKITLEKHSIVVHLLLKLGHETISTYAKNENAYIAIHKSMLKLKQIANKHIALQIDSRRQRKNRGELDAQIEQDIPYRELEKFNFMSTSTKDKKFIPVLHKKVRQISQKKMHIKTLSEKEAIKELESSTDMILFFLGHEDHKFKLIYEKDHGHYDIIEIGEAKYY